MITFTKHSLQKLENLFEELGYVVRYEKGNFTSGYCMVEERKIAIINKFYDAEGRINVLLDILDSVEFDPGIFSEKTAKFHERIVKHLANQQDDGEDDSENEDDSEGKNEN